jgi:hypothetical protein
MKTASLHLLAFKQRLYELKTENKISELDYKYLTEKLEIILNIRQEETK